MESPTAYIPIDRRLALARGSSLPDRARGVALFADISGFTPLAEALVQELGPQRGAEELSLHLNEVYDALIDELHRYGGSAVSFTGDAMTCWFDASGTDLRPAARRAVASALSMQRAMTAFASVAIPSGHAVSLAVKIAVAAGPARRFVVGDPAIQLIDVLAGATFDRLAQAERQARKGELVLDLSALEALGADAAIAAWRSIETLGQRFAVVDRLNVDVPASPWPELEPGALSADQARPWLLPPVHERLQAGQGEFLAELRPAVALFLNFSGISYDDDNAAARLDAFVRHAQQTIARYNGALLSLNIGDKGSVLYAAFGAPLAHEDDPARAASVALELRAPPLDYIRSVQMGLSQGRMRTGAYGASGCRTYGVLGDEVNVAARLMQAAAPGQILAGQAVRQSAGDQFTWGPPQALRVKGKAEPVPAFGLLGRRARRAVHHQEPKYALPMIGRAPELALIEGCLEAAAGGRGQVVGITAEAGMGKSRLVAEAARLAQARGWAGYVGECQSYGTSTSYLVWHNLWRSFFEVDPDLDAARQAASLEAQLRAIDPALAVRTPLLGAALNLPLPDNDLTATFDAQLRKTSLEALLAECVQARAAQAPLFFILEDCHWLDPLSQDLIEVVGRAITDLPVLLLLAYRPAGAPARLMQALPRVTEVRLTDFTPDEAAQLIGLKLQRFFGPGVAAPPALVERLTARAQGNPFYIEELLNYLRDRQVALDDEAGLDHLELPASLQSLILSRIDQLSESQKSTLKVASVIGRLFRATMLWGAYPQLGSLEQIKADLQQLHRLDLTPLDVPEPELVYLFKHVITQEVAYESLPFATRAFLHEQIGLYLEQAPSEVREQMLDLLAHHFGLSHNQAKKREYWLKAGQAAQARYANAVAIEFYRQVMPLLPPADQVPALRQLGQVLKLTGRWDEAMAVFQQAFDLAGQLNDLSTRARCQTDIGDLFWKQAQYVEARAWLARAQLTFEMLGDDAGLGQTLHLSGTLAAQQGDLDAARALYEQSLDLRRRLDDRPSIASLLNNLGIIARFQGDPALAERLNAQGLALRRELGDRRAIANSLNNEGMLALDQGDHARARQRLEEALQLLREIGDRWGLANSLNNLANVARDQGDAAAAQALYVESLTINRELGDRLAVAYLLEDIGRLAVRRDRAGAALRLLGAAQALRDVIGAPLPPAEQESLDRSLAPAREALGPDAQAAALAAGQAMSLEEAFRYALHDPTSPLV